MNTTHSITSYQMRIALLEARKGAENQKIVAKLRRKIRAIEALNS